MQGVSGSNAECGTRNAERTATTTDLNAENAKIAENGGNWVTANGNDNRS